MNFPGNCFYNHIGRKMWLDIPKNASKSISHDLMKMGWENGNYIKDSIYDYEAIIIVRDVVGRWKGSTIEVCYHHLMHNNFKFDNFTTWFEKKDWKNFKSIGDHHHQPLSYFCRDLINPKYIAMDKNFKLNIYNVLGISELKTINSTIENEHKLKVEPYVNELLSDPAFVEILLEHYKEDQALFLAASAT
jgi:hypothetical protein